MLRYDLVPVGEKPTVAVPQMRLYEWYEAPWEDEGYSGYGRSDSGGGCWHLAAESYPSAVLAYEEYRLVAGAPPMNATEALGLFRYTGYGEVPPGVGWAALARAGLNIEPKFAAGRAGRSTRPLHDGVDGLRPAPVVWPAGQAMPLGAVALPQDVIAAAQREYIAWAVKHWAEVPPQVELPRHPTPPILSDPQTFRVVGHWARGEVQTRYSVEARGHMANISEATWMPGTVDVTCIGRKANGQWSWSDYRVYAMPEATIWTYERATRNELWRTLSSDKGCWRWVKGDVRTWADVPQGYANAYRWWLSDHAKELDLLASMAT